METLEDWALWKKGKKNLLSSLDLCKEGAVASAPKLDFVPMLFRRRLSDISKMVVWTVHQVSKGLEPVKNTFASEFGEIQRQLKISMQLLETNNVSPSHFSLSVFNSPAAASSISEQNMAGYSATFAGPDSFRAGLIEAVSALKSGADEERIFVFADEGIPETYAPISCYPNVPIALALRLSVRSDDGAVPLKDFRSDEWPCTKTAAEQVLHFIKQQELV
mgnify:FL=1